MPKFEPPTQRQAIAHQFWGRWKIPVGQSVVLRNGRYEIVPTPWLGEIKGLRDGIDYFLGGHVYEVSDAVASQLEADGFVVQHETGGFGSGPFGAFPFGGAGSPVGYGVSPYGQDFFGS